MLVAALVLTRPRACCARWRARSFKAEQQSSEVIAAVERLTDDDQTLLKRMEVAGRGASAAAVISASIAATSLTATNLASSA